MRARELLGAWYERSREVLDRGYDQWFAPPTDEVIEAAVTGADVDEPLVRLGAARAHAGYSEIEALSDLAILLEVLPGPLRRRLAAPPMVAAFTAGFETVGPQSFPQAAEVGGVESLKARMAGLYRDRTRAGGDLAADHALVIVDVSAVDEPEAGTGVVVHSTAEEVREHFPLVDEIAWLRDGRFGVLVRRHPGVALGLASLEAALRQRPELTGTTVTTWLEPLPSTATALARLVRRAMASPAHEALAARAAAGDPISPSELATALARPPDGQAARRRRDRRRRVAAWREALSMVGAGVVALLVAAGVSQVVGPFEGGQIPSVTTVLGGRLFAEPHVEAATPPLQPSPPPVPVEELAIEEAPVVLPPTQPLAAVTPPTTAPVPPPAPPPVTTPTTSPPAPPPPTTATTVAPTPTTVAPAPAPEPETQVSSAENDGEPCAGLSGRDARRCEADQRKAEKERRKAERRNGDAHDNDDDDDDD